jgi:protein subunit release factor B
MTRQHLLTIDRHDFDITPFRGSGNGGQNRNKVETGIRIEHKQSGIVTQACEERTQLANKKIAFNRMISNKKFRDWLRIESLRRAALIPTEHDLEKMVDRMLSTENLKYEIKVDGKWTEVSEEYFKSLTEK